MGYALTIAGHCNDLFMQFWLLANLEWQRYVPKCIKVSMHVQTEQFKPNSDWPSTKCRIMEALGKTLKQ